MATDSCYPSRKYDILFAVKQEKNYISVREAAEKWKISARRVRMLCAEGKIIGAFAEGKLWRIPVDVPRPVDGRTLRYGGIPVPLLNLVREVDALKDELVRHRPLSTGECERLRESFLVDYTHASTAIEGNTLTLSETALALKGVTIGQKPLKDHLEAIGHRDAFVFLEEVVRSGGAITEELVKKLHALVLADRPMDRGVYRRIPVVITGAVHTPPQPYLVGPQMEAWVHDLQKTHLHPVVAAALFHLKFEAIHPFIDGNGRTGRLLVNFILMKAGYLPVSVKYEDRVAYYAAFTSFHRDGDVVPMTRIFLEAEKERLSNWLGLLSAKPS